MFEVLTNIEHQNITIIISALAPIAIGGYLLWAWLEKKEPFDK